MRSRNDTLKIRAESARSLAALPGGLISRMRYYMAERGRRFLKSSAYTIAFLPSRPSPEHLIWGANRQAGGRVIKNPHKADAVFYFDEKTKARPPRRPNPMAPGFNFFCPDVSQTRIATAFETVFGYALAANPETFKGPMAVKPKFKGMPDNAVVQGPCPRHPRMTYQPLIDNEIHEGYVVEFRCLAVKGEIPLVCVAMRPIEQRFGKINTSVAIVPPADVFTSAELEQISRFCSEIGLDWGGLDILRDKITGKIYIVDVDRTQVKPPHKLSLKDRLRSTKILGGALREAIINQPGIIPIIKIPNAKLKAKPVARTISKQQSDVQAHNDVAPTGNVHVLDIVPVRISS